METKKEKKLPPFAAGNDQGNIPSNCTRTLNIAINYGAPSRKMNKKKDYPKYSAPVSLFSPGIDPSNQPENRSQFWSRLALSPYGKLAGICPVCLGRSS